MYLKINIKTLNEQLFNFIFSLTNFRGSTHPTRIATNSPPKGSIILFVTKSKNSKKLKFINLKSDQILKEKILPIPKNHTNKPKNITMIFLLILNSSSIQAVNGSKSEMAELRAAIVINTKKIIEKKGPNGKE